MSTKPAVSAIEVLESTASTLRALLGSLPESVTAQAGAEGWSPKDVLAHLISIQEPALRKRIGLMVENEEPAVPNVDEEAVLESSGLRARPLAQLLDQFEGERGEAMAWVKELPPGAFSRGGLHEVAGRITVADQLNHFAYHDLMHIRQIVSLLIPRLERARGAMGESFPDSG